MGVLKYASQQGFGPVLGFVDDFADFFNQIATHPSQWWMSCFAWLPLLGMPGRLCFVSEHRLGFGYSASSGIAQRFGEGLLRHFRKEFDAEEEVIFDRLLCTLPPDDPRAIWIRGRRALSAETGHNECRLYSLDIFTDDMSCDAVGVDRWVRAMRCWRRVVVRRFCLRMAIAKKRSNGPSYTWTGADFYLVPALLSVPRSKRVLMLVSLDRVLAEAEVTWGEFQQLAGRLEHVITLLSETRRLMYFLYGPIAQRGFRLGRSSLILYSPELLQQARVWRQLVVANAGCFASQTLARRPLAHPTSLASLTGQFVWSSDASKDGARVPGAGGYLHGYYFTYAWTEQDLELHITALEFCAVVLAVLVFCPLLVGAEIVALGDASVVDAILRGDSASSPVLQFIHLRLTELPEFSLPARLRFKHWAGEANFMADASSRGELEALRLGAAFLGVLAHAISTSSSPPLHTPVGLLNNTLFPA